MFRLLLTLVCVCVLLVGCSSNSKEQEAAQALDNAHSQAQTLSLDKAILLYQAVIDRYPQTPQAEGAVLAMAQLESQKNQQFKSSATKLLERVSTVLDGYQAFVGTLPLKLQDLDTGGYLFDSNYLAEMLPADATLYLLLDAQKTQTRMWLQQAGQVEVVSRNLALPQTSLVSLAELKVLQAQWQEIAKVGRMTQVQL